jgi:hypothetical protein
MTAGISRSGEVSVMAWSSSSRRLSSLGIHSAVFAAMVCSAATAAGGTARTGGPPLARVRSNTPSIAAIIQDAAERSPLFRRLIETIDATDGLVYVDEGKCGHGVSACLVLSVQVAGPHRLLRILVDPHKHKRDCDLMAYTIRKRLTRNRQSPFRSRTSGAPIEGSAPMARTAALTGRLMSGGRCRSTAAT